MSEQPTPIRPDAAQPRNRVGRKTRRTPEVTRRICDALRMGASRRAASQAAGVDQSSLYEWMNKFPEFSREIRQAEAEAEIRFTAPIAQAAREGDWKAGLSWLERRYPDEWAPRQKLEARMEFDLPSFLANRFIPPPLPEPAEPPEVIILDQPPADDEPPPPSTNGTNGKVH